MSKPPGNADELILKALHTLSWAWRALQNDDVPLAQDKLDEAYTAIIEARRVTSARLRASR